MVGGLYSLSENDFGRPWPLPNRRVIRESVENFDHDLCLKAAKEAREIVQAQDRAPNITGLYLKKLEDLNSVRAVVRDSLGSAA